VEIVDLVKASIPALNKARTRTRRSIVRGGWDDYFREAAPLRRSTWRRSRSARGRTTRARDQQGTDDADPCLLRRRDALLGERVPLSARSTRRTRLIAS